jgi:hypothetical protein
MYATAQQIESFRSFALQQLAGGDVELTIDELYDRWRLQQPDEQELRDNVRAVKASLRDMERGTTGRAFDEFAGDFRSQHRPIDLK